MPRRVALRLKNPEGRDWFLALVAKADLRPSKLVDEALRVKDIFDSIKNDEGKIISLVDPVTGEKVRLCI